MKEAQLSGCLGRVFQRAGDWHCLDPLCPRMVRTGLRDVAEPNTFRAGKGDTERPETIQGLTVSEFL